MLDPYRLSLQVESAGGPTYKWGPDSPDGRNVPQDLEFTTAQPGGYKDLQSSLLREFVRTSPDTNLLDRVRVSAPGGRTVFDGFFTSFPKQQGQAPTVAPAAIGWAGLLMFTRGFQRIYVDRDLSAWGSMPLNEQIRVAAVPGDIGSFSWSNDAGGLICALPNQAIPANAERSVWYTCPAGAGVGKLMYIGAQTVVAAVAAAAFISSTQDSYFGGAEVLAPTLDGTLRTLTPSAARRYLAATLSFASAGTPAAGNNRRYSALAVYGNHGLTTRPIDASTPDGLYNSDIVADIVRQTTPELNFTTGAGGSIESNTQIVPHLAFKDPIAAADAIARASAFGIDPFTIPEWGVYNDKQFFWRSPDPDRLCWQARLSDGAKPRLEGRQADDQVNGVLVSFSDPSGIRRIVGPPAAYWPTGVALADTTDATLVDSSADNPVNAHGLGPKWAKLELSQTATTAGAIALGAIFLAIQSQPQRRGQIELTGLVRHPTISQPQAVYNVKAGDYVRITDSSESDVNRRVIATRYSHATRTLTADIDNTPFTLDALLEAMQASLVGVT